MPCVARISDIKPLSTRSTPASVDLRANGGALGFARIRLNHPLSYDPRRVLCMHGAPGSGAPSEGSFTCASTGASGGSR
jgi:hypothetical protein